jgi:ferredoxin
VPIIPSGGVRSGDDILGYIAAGANAAELCAQGILEGPGVARRIEKEIRTWMTDNGVRKLSELQGLLQLLKHEEAKNVPQWLPAADKELCNACKRCIQACPNGAISLLDNSALIDEEYCEGCRTCYYVCPTGAITLSP